MVMRTRVRKSAMEYGMNISQLSAHNPPTAKLDSAQAHLVKF